MKKPIPILQHLKLGITGRQKLTYPPPPLQTENLGFLQIWTEHQKLESQPTPPPPPKSSIGHFGLFQALETLPRHHLEYRSGAPRFKMMNKTGDINRVTTMPHVRSYKQGFLPDRPAIFVLFSSLILQALFVSSWFQRKWRDTWWLLSLECISLIAKSLNWCQNSLKALTMEFNKKVLPRERKSFTARHPASSRFLIGGGGTPSSLGWGVPIQSWIRGYPSSPGWGYPSSLGWGYHIQSWMGRGTPSNLQWGVPPSRPKLGYPLLDLGWATPHPDLALGGYPPVSRMWYPLSRPGMGYLPPLDLGWGTHPVQTLDGYSRSRPWMGYLLPLDLGWGTHPVQT